MVTVASNSGGVKDEAGSSNNNSTTRATRTTRATSATSATSATGVDRNMAQMLKMELLCGKSARDRARTRAQT